MRSINSKMKIVNEFYKQYEIYVDLNEDFISELYTVVLKAKGDWINFDYNDSLNICYTDLGLIFHNEKLDDRDEEIINKTIDAIENLINKKSLPTTKIDSKLYGDTFSENGLLISIKDLTEGNIVDKDLLIKYFSENSIKYNEVLHQGHNFDGGASGGSDSFIFFLTSAILSGMSWDMIKYGISEVLNCSQDLVKINILENFHFNKLRKIIEDRSKIEKEDLILTDLKRDENNDLILTFMSKKGKVFVRANDTYQIKEYKYKPYSDEDFIR